MKIINDKKQIQSTMEKLEIAKIMNCDTVTFAIHEFEKGEVISGPGKKLRYLRFWISGDVQIYGIREDGAMVYLSLMKKGNIIGDVEFVDQAETMFFAEAMENAYFLAVDMNKYHDELHRDPLLLNYILKEMLDKMQRNAANRVENQTLEEKVLRYLRYQSEDHRLHGIQKTLPILQCSKRNLQRVLQRLCEQGVIVKEKKGQYKLIDTAALIGIAESEDWHNFSE